MTRPLLVPVLLGSFALALCWLVPGHFYPWVAFEHELVAAIGGLLIGLGALASSPSGLAWPRMASFVALVAAVPLIQLLTRQIAFVSDGVLVFLYLASLAAALAVGATLAQTQRRTLLDALFGSLLAGGIVSVGLACFQWLGLGPVGYVAWIPPGDRPFANLGQPNQLAALLALSTLGGLWLYETRRINGPVMLLIAAWLILGLVMSRSRMLWIAIPVVVCGWLLLTRRTPSRAGAGAALGFMAAFAVGVLLWSPMSEAIGTAAPVSVAERVQSGGGRIRIWTALGSALLDSPWVGYGWSQVSRAGLAGSLEHYTGEHMLRNSHNILLDLLLWNGIPLGLLIIGVLTYWLVQQVRRCDSAERGVVLSAVIVIVVYATLEFPLEYLNFLIPTGLFAGALSAWDKAEQMRSLPRWASTVLLSALLGMTTWVAVEYLRVEEASRENRMLAAGYARSAALPDVVLLDEPREYMKFWRTRAKAVMSTEDIEWMRKLTSRNPAPPTLLRYALAMGLNGRPQVAADTLVRLCNMHAADRCDEGRRSWSQLQSQHAVLNAIAYPSTPGRP